MTDNMQSSQGQTLQRAMQEGRDPSSSWGQPGFEPPTEPQSFKFDGNIQSAPDWVDRGWASCDAGPALAVPKGDPSKPPYTTQSARVGDTVMYTPGKGGSFGSFKVVRAEEMGEQPGAEPLNGPGDRSTPTFRPAAQTEASLEDLVKTGQVAPEDMDPEARAQYYARIGQGKAQTAEEAGHIPSQDGSQPAPSYLGSQDPNVGAPPRGDLPPPEEDQYQR